MKQVFIVMRSPMSPTSSYIGDPTDLEGEPVKCFANEKDAEEYAEKMNEKAEEEREEEIEDGGDEDELLIVSYKVVPMTVE